MQELNTLTAIPTNAIKAEALANMSASFERFCLAAGLEALAEMIRDAARPAGRTAALPGLHQHHREPHGHGAARLLQREILALAFNGSALDGRPHARGRQGFPAPQGP
jgi:hypothetical protein